MEFDTIESQTVVSLKINLLFFCFRFAAKLTTVFSVTYFCCVAETEWSRGCLFFDWLTAGDIATGCLSFPRVFLLFIEVGCCYSVFACNY